MQPSSQTAAPNQPEARIDPNATVIPKFRQNPESEHLNLSVFSDRRWDLGPGIHAKNLESARRFMSFSFYPKKWRSFIWTFSWLAMNFDHFEIPDRIRSVPPGSVKCSASLLYRYIRFMENRGVALADVTLEDNLAWAAKFSGKSYGTRIRAVALPRRLYWYRAYFPEHVPEAHPWLDIEVVDLVGIKEPVGENTTDRVPRAILDPILKWALFLMGDAFNDVLSKIRSLHGASGLGYEASSHIPGTNLPWMSPKPRLKVSYEWAHLLTTAGYIVVAYLSGMRDGEVQAIKRGCTRVKRDAKGEIYRYSLRSLTFKKGDPTGKPVMKTWVVIPEVHQALSRMEMLSELMHELQPDSFDLPDADLLFRRYGRLSSGLVSLTTNINPWLRRFEATINQLASDAADRVASSDERRIVENLYKVPPTESGERWRWITKQFRRTVAWYIANEPFGIVAGMRQYGHIRDTTYQGYAGTLLAGFRDEVDLARHVGKMRDLLEMYEDVLDGSSLGGPKGKVLEREFRAIAERIGDLPGKVVDEKRLLGMLKNVSREVYPGILNYCFFDSATALCLKRYNTTKRAKPIFAACDWTKCPNSCFASAHGPALNDALAETLELRKTPRLSKNQREALDTVATKFRSSLQDIGCAS